MATKAGRVQFKDIKAGKVFWLVRAGWGKALVDDGKGGNRLSLTWCHHPERMVILERPWRSMTDYSPSAVWKPTPDWSFKARVYFDDYVTEELVYDCSSYGIPTPEHPEVQATFIFVTQKAAQRYFEHVKSANYQTLFEHPAQWKSTGLRKRVSTLYNGKHAVYGDIPTRTNSHRPWLRLRPTEFLMGGMVMDQDTPQSTREHFQRESAKELSLMYPNVIVELKWAKDPDAFKQPDPKTLYPGSVLIPNNLTPEQRAAVEKDFVILDEAHQLDGDPQKLAKIIEEFRTAAVDTKGRNILGYDPAGPTLTSVRISDGDQITYAAIFTKKN
jgi:hypothetical protein